MVEPTTDPTPASWQWIRPLVHEQAEELPSAAAEADGILTELPRRAA